MKKFTQEKGITLIALIITIIVMLILVAVTITVALNGGLFTKADDSSLKTEKQSVYEQVVAAMELDNNGNLDVNETGKAAEAHFDSNGLEATWDSSTGKLTVVGKRGTYEIVISADGINQPILANGNTNSSEGSGGSSESGGSVPTPPQGINTSGIAGTYLYSFNEGSWQETDTIVINSDGTGTRTPGNSSGTGETSNIYVDTYNGSENGTTFRIRNESNSIYNSFKLLVDSNNASNRVLIDEDSSKIYIMGSNLFATGNLAGKSFSYENGTETNQLYFFSEGGSCRLNSMLYYKYACYVEDDTMYVYFNNEYVYSSDQDVLYNNSTNPPQIWTRN